MSKPNRTNLINIRWPNANLKARHITWAPSANWTWARFDGDHGLMLFIVPSISDN